MDTSTDFALTDQSFPEEVILNRGEVVVKQTQGLSAAHPSEADTFARHSGVPGHDQQVLASTNIAMAGAGGLNSWVALGLLRSGVANITIIDPDIVERTNLPRQFYFEGDLGKNKTSRLVSNLSEHALVSGNLTGIAMTFEEAFAEFAFPADVIVVGVDRNDCRLFGARKARELGIPAVFSMLSTDGMRCQVFYQGPARKDACLWCALPNLDPDKVTPCASAIISSCFLAASTTLFFIHRALMGWPEGHHLYNWRDVDLLGSTPDQQGFIKQREGCGVCRDYK